ncbi:hypothetical protein JVU11DRAFT_2128 [Chiua virens]|nr:hypothetical protein JVU11DRAFT_2128 [Chiua virens]
MAILPLFRVIIFTLISLFSLVVLGICAHIEYLASPYSGTDTEIYLSFAAVGIGAACLTLVSLPLFLVLGSLRTRRVFTSMILFEIIWFFILWVLWVGTAADTVFGKAYIYPDGCIYSDYPQANSVCDEFTAVEAFAFLNFFAAFIYYDVIILYAIINAIRGTGVWTTSVKEAANRTPSAVNPGVPMGQPMYNATPAAQYGAFPSNIPPAQPYNVYPQQVPPQGPLVQPYNAYPQQVPSQGTPPQPYGAYPPQSPHTIQNQPYYTPPTGSPQSQPSYPAYSPNSAVHSNALLPPQPNYSSYPAANAPQAPLPLPSGYEEQQPIPPHQQPAHGASPV